MIMWKLKLLFLLLPTFLHSQSKLDSFFLLFFTLQRIRTPLSLTELCIFFSGVRASFTALVCHNSTVGKCEFKPKKNLETYLKASILSLDYNPCVGVLK